MKILFVFIDGLGIGVKNVLYNPLTVANIPVLDNLLTGKTGTVVAADACLGIKGIPQSATGQTALFTGINAARMMGRHISGFPGPTLRKLLAEKNILLRLKKLGRKVAFANAYTEDYVEKVRAGKAKGSVTTVSLLTAKIPFRFISQIKEGKAVYQDFSNALLREKGYSVPLFAPEQAAKNLTTLAKEHDFTLYEYFQTDRAGHQQDLSNAVNLLQELDRFIGSIVKYLNLSHTLLIISSDHGNIEDLSIKTHTKNPVPVILLGKAGQLIKNKIRGITDIIPAILSLYKSELKEGI